MSFQQIVMLVGKAGAYLSEAPLRYLRVGSWPYPQKMTAVSYEFSK